MDMSRGGTRKSFTSHGVFLLIRRLTNIDLTLIVEK